jgi:peptide/nickel transport system permease protein
VSTAASTKPTTSDAAARTAKDAVQGDSYWDIVWRQFKKNRAAVIAMWLLVPLFLVAIFAPAIASNQPFVFFDHDETIFPWWRALFHPTEPIDFFYNMAMLGFFPWAIAAFATNIVLKRNGVPGRRRIGYAAGMFAVITLGLCLVFGLPEIAPSWMRLPKLAPSNKYMRRTFVTEEFHANRQVFGLYPPIAFGMAENDPPSRFEPPFYRKPRDQRKDLNDGDLHILGTDDGGRDVLTRLIHGSRVSMSVGFVAVAIYISIGIVVGAIAGYFGGIIDMLISRVIEVVLLFPSFFLILTLVALIGPSIWIIMFVIGITGWPGIARLIRGEVLKQRALEYTAAAKALGVSQSRIIFRHVLPNSIAPALVAVPFGISSAIITEAGLSLLGFGVQSPTASWGSVLQGGYGNYQYSWMIIYPSLAMFMTLTVFNLVGSGLRDAMDPRLRV